MPLTSGSTVAAALRNMIDLARQVERSGYARYWLAEHHLTPSVACAAPAVLIALVADATRRIRVGSGAVQTAYQTPLVIAEQFGTIGHIHPGRIDLGLGRSRISTFIDKATDAVSGSTVGLAHSGERQPSRPCVVDGLLIPAPPRFRFDPYLLRQQLELVGYRDGAGDDYALQVRAIQAFIRGDYRTHNGVHLRAPAAEGADLELWILAASAGESARTAGALGLPLTANYHSMPSAVLDTVVAYRAAFRPSETLRAPYVMVSADVVVADELLITTVTHDHAARVRSYELLAQAWAGLD
ncbi:MULTISPECIES: LLM class flavin-dependent oxidoreductase [unclassified Frankia]|uniref:LLM class flavin-dependent oxidoreductase n=1 Tax=unclassified Frankia TaxID=2632575 RepID=UPI002AD45F9D|nr:MULTISPECIES: LLM class flavin-dependent oxidoreductase [unclassified Frankia]